MADIRPFRALRYHADRLADPGSVLAPPYDVISAGQQEQLYEANPNNIIRIEYPKTEHGDRYRAAADALRDWEATGVLARDARPALYRYEQHFRLDGEERTRTALFARLRVEPWDRGIILPHEYTLSKPKEDRLNLLRATRTNVSPVYGLYRDDDADVAAILAGAPAEKLYAGRDILGHEHRLSAVSDEGALAEISAFFADRRLYIADGHHRYETALAYRDEVKAGRPNWTGDEAENFALVALTSIDDKGLVILPIHRLVHQEPVGDLRNLLDEDFEVHAIGPEGQLSLERLIIEIEEGGPHTFGLAGPAGAPLRILRPKGKAAYNRTPADMPDALRNLNVSVLQSAILERCFGISVDDVAAGEAVDFTEDADKAMGVVLTGEARYAVLISPTKVEQLLAVADSGARMPQKSTYFYPKLGTGLVLNPLDG